MKKIIHNEEQSRQLRYYYENRKKILKKLKTIRENMTEEDKLKKELRQYLRLKSKFGNMDAELEINPTDLVDE